MNRRNFIKTVGAASLSSTIYPREIIGAEVATAGVYEVYDAGLMTGKDPNNLSAINDSKVTLAIDSIIKRMAGKTDLGKAWESVFPGITATSKICIKINVLQAQKNFPQFITLKAMVNGMKSMFGGTYPAGNISIVDNNLWKTLKVDRAYGAAKLNQLGIWHGEDNYQGASIKAAGKTVYVSKRYTDAHYGINFLTPRRHTKYAGKLSGFIKNMMGAVSTDRTTYKALSSTSGGQFHDNSSFTGYVDLFKNYMKQHTHLYVSDLITAPATEAASVYDFIFNRVAMGTDPVAMDSYVYSVLNTHYTDKLTKAVPEALKTAGLGSTAFNLISVSPSSISQPADGKASYLSHVSFSVRASGFNNMELQIPLKKSDQVNRFDIVDVLGRQIFSMKNGKEARAFTWNGTDSHGRLVKAGHYVLRIRTNDSVSQRKFHLQSY